MYEDTYWHNVANEMISFTATKYQDYSLPELRRLAEKLVLRSINWTDANAYLIAKHYNIILEIKNDKH